MAAVVDAAHDGMPVLGICNGFQVLCESHLLPGALVGNAGRRFVCRAQELRIENAQTAWTGGYRAGQELVIPIKNMDGCYVADDKTLDELEDNGRVVVRYIRGNPNGSYRDIAGITNEAGNVVGLMPHPEHAADPLTGSGGDGLRFFTALAQAVAAR
jgi:phosphoribosylformylglycinamidine synthase